MFDVLVVEDDKSLQKLMIAILRQHGYRVSAAKDGIEALEILGDRHLDLVICDVMMPRLDGFQLTEALRQAGVSIPIVMVTVRETLADKKRGFMAGTDDYMVKPIDMDELVLRVSALLRRAKIQNQRRLVIGDVEIDYDALSVTHSGITSNLPMKEFLLFFKLMSYPDKTFTRQQLMDEIWGMDVDTDERTVDVHIKRLRDRFRNIPSFDIVTVRGLGYKAVITK